MGSNSDFGNFYDGDCENQGLYSLFRHKCGPTLYGSNKTAVTADVLEAGLLFAAAVLLISFLTIVPGYFGKERWLCMFRRSVAVFILASIMVCNFGQEWETGELETRTPYRAGLQEEIHAHIGVKIGLRSVNITLRADPEVVTFKNGTHEERINYNERFHWDNLGFDLGRAGFGPFAGRFNQEFREAQRKGLPYPILWIAEYFTIDGENIRWGRHYLQAGWWTHIMIWAAFPLWCITIMLLMELNAYGGYSSILTGLVMLIGNVLFYTIRNPVDLNGAIPFEDGRIHLHLGWCFWLNLATGALCTLIGIIILVVDHYNVVVLVTFLGKNILDEYEDVYAVQSVDDLQEVNGDNLMLRSMSHGAVSVYSTDSALSNQVFHYQRRRGTNISATFGRKHNQKVHGRPSIPNLPNVRRFISKQSDAFSEASGHDAQAAATSPAVDIEDNCPLTPPSGIFSAEAKTHSFYDNLAVDGDGFKWPQVERIEEDTQSTSSSEIPVMVHHDHHINGQVNTQRNTLGISKLNF